MLECSFLDLSSQVRVTQCGKKILRNFNYFFFHEYIYIFTKYLLRNCMDYVDAKDVETSPENAFRYTGKVVQK